MATGGDHERNVLTTIWRIEKMNLWESGPDGKGISGPDFTPFVFEGKCLRLVVYREVKETVGKFLRFSLWRDGDAFAFPIDCEISLVDHNGSPVPIGIKKDHVIEKNRLFTVSSIKNETVFGTQVSKFLPQGNLTVRCLIWKSRGDFSNSEFISTRTQIESLENSFRLPITGFSTLSLNHEFNFPVKFSCCNSLNDFQVKFSFKGESLALASFCVQFIVTSMPSALMVSLKVLVLGDEEREMINAEIKSIAGSQLFDIPIYPIGTREELLRRRSCLENDALTLFCKIVCVQSSNAIGKQTFGFQRADVDILKTVSLCFNETSTPFSVDPTSVSLRGRNSVVEDLLVLYKKKIQTDFELRSGEVSFSVHKCILTARSIFFRDLFLTGTNEQNSNCMEVPDLDAQTLERMVIFLYSGNLDGLNWQNSLKLYYAAVKYQVRSLRNECFSFIQSNINVKNVGDIMSLLEKNKTDELESCIIDFIPRHFDEIMSSKEGKEFAKREPILTMELKRKIYLKYMENKYQQKYSTPLC